MNSKTPPPQQRPCPFCNSSDIEGRVELYGPFSGLHYSKCTKCSTRSGYADNVDLATELWNTRPSLPETTSKETAEEVLKKHYNQLLTDFPDVKCIPWERSLNEPEATAVLAAMEEHTSIRTKELQEENSQYKQLLERTKIILQQARARMPETNGFTDLVPKQRWAAYQKLLEKEGYRTEKIKPTNKPCCK